MLIYKESAGSEGSDDVDVVVVDGAVFALPDRSLEEDEEVVEEAGGGNIETEGGLGSRM